MDAKELGDLTFKAKLGDLDSSEQEGFAAEAVSCLLFRMADREGVSKVYFNQDGSLQIGNTYIGAEAVRTEVGRSVYKQVVCTRDEAARKEIERLETNIHVICDDLPHEAVEHCEDLSDIFCGELLKRLYATAKVKPRTFRYYLVTGQSEERITLTQSLEEAIK